MIRIEGLNLKHILHFVQHLLSLGKFSISSDTSKVQVLNIMLGTPRLQLFNLQ